jgi:hypothetical protein
LLQANKKEALKRLWWKKWEMKWSFVDGPVGQLVLSGRVGILTALAQA